MLRPTSLPTAGTVKGSEKPIKFEDLCEASGRANAVLPAARSETDRGPPSNAGSFHLLPIMSFDMFAAMLNSIYQGTIVSSESQNSASCLSNVRLDELIGAERFELAPKLLKLRGGRVRRPV